MSISYYETDRARSEYLLFHFGAPDQVLPYSFGPRDALDFPRRCVAECLNPNSLPEDARALDVGCAVGRSTFELARFCRQVIGVDFSRGFIEAANRLKRDGALPYRYVVEGDLTNAATALVPMDIDRERAFFEQGDAQKLRKDLGAFDVVLLANLIDRLRDPSRCLRRLPELVKSGGRLIITSPCTWLAEYTPKENRLGGFERDGEPVRTLATLKRILQPPFEFSVAKDLPFLIREHARKYQWCVAEASIWIRR